MLSHPLHSRDNCHLLMMFNPFKMLLSGLLVYCVGVVCTGVSKGCWSNFHWVFVKFCRHGSVPLIECAQTSLLVSFLEKFGKDWCYFFKCLVDSPVKPLDPELFFNWEIFGYWVCLLAAAAAAESLQSCPNSVRRHRRQPTGLPCPWGSPGKNAGVGCHFLLPSPY